MKGSHHPGPAGQRAQTPGQGVHGRVQAVGRRLVLDVDDIGAELLAEMERAPPQLPAGVVDLRIDRRLIGVRGGAQMIPAGVRIGQDMDIHAQRAERLAQLPGIVADAALHGGVFTGDEEDAHGEPRPMDE